MSIRVTKLDLAGNETVEQAGVVSLGRGLKPDQDPDGVANLRLGEEILVQTPAAGVVTPDFSKTFIVSITLNAVTVTINDPIGTEAGSTYIIILKQDATGGRAANWGTAYKWSGGTAPALSGAANAVDIVTMVAESPTVIYTSLARDFS